MRAITLAIEIHVNNDLTSVKIDFHRNGILYVLYDCYMYI